MTKRDSMLPRRSSTRWPPTSWSSAYIRVPIVTRGSGSLGLDPSKTTDPAGHHSITDAISLYPPNSTSTA